MFRLDGEKVTIRSVFIGESACFRLVMVKGWKKCSIFNKDYSHVSSEYLGAAPTIKGS